MLKFFASLPRPRASITRASRFCLVAVSAMTLFGTGSAGAADQEQLVPVQVEAGTNLINLAKSFCKNPDDWQRLARLNKLSAPYVIYADGEIQAPLDALQIENLSLTAATVKGTASLLRANGETVALQSGATVEPGDTVITGGESYVQLLFPNELSTRVEPESRVKVGYLFRMNDGRIKADVALSEGGVVHKIDRKLKFNESVRARTPVVITGIRGTEYRLKTDGPKSTRVETLRGAVTVRTNGGKTMQLAANHGVRAQGGQLGAVRHLPQPPVLTDMETLFKSLPMQIRLPQQKGIRQVKLRLSTDAKGQATIYENTAPVEEALVVENVPDGHYYAFFTAIDAQGFESIEQATRELDVRTVPPAPVLSRPRNGSVQWGEVAGMDWLSHEQAARYQVQVAKDPEFSEIVDEKTIASAAYASPVLPPGQYWGRVRAEAADGFVSNYSATVAWEQKTPPAMKGMESTSAEPPVLQWAETGAEQRYALQVSLDREFRELLVDEKNLTAASYTFRHALDPGDYHVHLCTIDANGQSSPWTPAQTLKVKNPPKPLAGGIIGAALLGILLL